MALDSAAMTSFDFEYLSQHYVAAEQDCVDALIGSLQLDATERAAIAAKATSYAAKSRENFAKQSFVDHLLQEYGLATKEGVEIMRLCEALIRTPDFETSRILIRDKLSNANWASHAGKSSKFLVNRATNGLQIAHAWARATGGVGADAFLSKMGDRVLDASFTQTMRVLGGHFVFAETIDTALKKAAKGSALFSFDMLGEAAHTAQDAERYFEAYLRATKAIAAQSHPAATVTDSHGISVKLSALHPRYEYAKRDVCVPILVQRLLEICQVAKRANIGVTIDAEEAERLEVSLLVLEQLLSAPELSGWDGLGFVVQAYQRRAYALISEITRLAGQRGRHLCIRLVKGAYWDAEIKRAQELGLESYPVFTRRENTDLSYLACAKQLLDARDTVFPQFASHNAHTLAAVENIAGNVEGFEFQRLHGMGDSLHESAVSSTGLVSRVYAPIGNHNDLLPYLVRRLVENGANSSFLNQLMDEELPIETVIADPFEQIEAGQAAQHAAITNPRDILNGARQSAEGLDTTQSTSETELRKIGSSVRSIEAASIIGGDHTGGSPADILNPADLSDIVGPVRQIGADEVGRAVSIAAKSGWGAATSSTERAEIFRNAADLLEKEADHFLELCVREAGKTYLDAIAEIREAVDFLRYYADQCETARYQSREPLGVVACISPWNFPLAIFLGQIAASLCAGNTVIAKPAPQTPIIAHEAIKLLHRAGVPEDTLHLLIGPPAEIGNALTGHPDVKGICFTGSTRTAKIIAGRLAETGRADTPLIAETGGINAMIVDSTALIEQAVADVVASAFQSAGQRCSACRVVCVQADIYEPFKKMLMGAMAELAIGVPADPFIDVGPVIDLAAKANIDEYIETAVSGGRMLYRTEAKDETLNGYYVSPTLIELSNVSELEREIFGPVLHILPFESRRLGTLVREINALGYGLTLGLHTRIDARAQKISETAHVGNLYVNRNQIGAVVGVQPFGGEGLSGTGPKAGGPHYLLQLTKARSRTELPDGRVIVETPISTTQNDSALRKIISATRAASEAWAQGLSVAERIEFLRRVLPHGGPLSEEFWTQLCFEEILQLPGPTGEDNQLILAPRGVLVCAGDGQRDEVVLIQQIVLSLASGSGVIIEAHAENQTEIEDLRAELRDNKLPANLVRAIPNGELAALVDYAVDGFVADGTRRADLAQRLNTRAGAILPLLSSRDPIERFCHERTVTINTTAAGGNASLLTLD